MDKPTKKIISVHWFIDNEWDIWAGQTSNKGVRAVVVGVSEYREREDSEE